MVAVKASTSGKARGWWEDFLGEVTFEFCLNLWARFPKGAQVLQRQDGADDLSQCSETETWTMCLDTFPNPVHWGKQLSAMVADHQGWVGSCQEQSFSHCHVHIVIQGSCQMQLRCRVSGAGPQDAPRAGSPRCFEGLAFLACGVDLPGLHGWSLSREIRLQTAVWWSYQMLWRKCGRWFLQLLTFNSQCSEYTDAFWVQAGKLKPPLVLYRG